jgi:hypothetical protein
VSLELNASGPRRNWRGCWQQPLPATGKPKHSLAVLAVRRRVRRRTRAGPCYAARVGPCEENSACSKTAPPHRWNLQPSRSCAREKPLAASWASGFRSAAAGQTRSM